MDTRLFLIRKPKIPRTAYILILLWQYLTHPLTNTLLKHRLLINNTFAKVVKPSFNTSFMFYPILSQRNAVLIYLV